MRETPQTNSLPLPGGLTGRDSPALEAFLQWKGESPELFKKG